jgi:hypothetical protein
VVLALNTAARDSPFAFPFARETGVTPGFAVTFRRDENRGELIVDDIAVARSLTGSTYTCALLKSCRSIAVPHSAGAIFLGSTRGSRAER